MQAERESVGVIHKHHPFAERVDQGALLDDDLYKYKHLLILGFIFLVISNYFGVFSIGK